MKIHSVFIALISAMAVGVAFSSCTNIDNPVDNTAPTVKYLLVNDSLVSTIGNTKSVYWEYDAEGRVVKEIAKFYDEDVLKSQKVYTYTYSPNLITKEYVDSNGETTSVYYHLNSKGLIEQVDDEYEECVYGYEYNDDDRIIAYVEDGLKDEVVWKDDDLVSYEFDGGPTAYYTMSDVELDFPYLLTFATMFDASLTKMGYYGKASRHLVSKMDMSYEEDGISYSYTESFDYVVRNGLVMEFTVCLGEESAHHYLTWKKQ